MSFAPRFTDQIVSDWQQHARDTFRYQCTSHYDRMRRLGATAAELQEIASLTYAGNYQNGDQHE